MSKPRQAFVCLNCGTKYTKWAGKCESCQAWNSLVESKQTSGIATSPNSDKLLNGSKIELTSLDGEFSSYPRIISKIGELDQVTGGGFVRGSVNLIGGEPGIGKSTLLTQTAAQLALAGYEIVYISGEEAIDQIRLRSERLGLKNSKVKLATETNIENILATLKAQSQLDLVIIDSIQTLWTASAEAAPGTVSQLRLTVQALINYAKSANVAVILVGHVTKDGQIAGPRVVEHMVDSVLYFEGSQNYHYRLLRSIKNRFGATNEIGVFEMSGYGLVEVSNPSALFLTDPHNRAPGAVIFAGIEGSRAILVEIQTLVVHSGLSNPRRTVVGWDPQRLAMILAILEAHCSIKLSQYDVYVNVAGGYKINEPGADLAIAAALLSSLFGVILPAKSVYFGEVSLSGRIRPVTQLNQRLKEAEKLGFNQAILGNPVEKTLNEFNLQLSFLNEILEVKQRIEARQNLLKPE